MKIATTAKVDRAENHAAATKSLSESLSIALVRNRFPYDPPDGEVHHRGNRHEDKP